MWYHGGVVNWQQTRAPDVCPWYYREAALGHIQHGIDSRTMHVIVYPTAMKSQSLCPLQLRTPAHDAVTTSCPCLG